MAARPNATLASYEGIMADLRRGEFKPLYLLAGEEPYFVDLVCQYIIDNALKEEERDFNLSVFYGADTSMRQVLEQARRFPMMAERQVVVLREALAADEFELLEKYIAHLVPTTVLVICAAGKVDRRKKYVTLAAANGVVFDSAPLRDYEVAAFAEQYAKGKGATLDRKASAMLVEFVGNELKRLVSEIDKILVAFPPGAPKNITSHIIEKCVGVSNEFNGFELRDAFVKKDIYRVNLIVNHIMKNPKSGGLFKMLPSIFQYFQNLMLAHYAPAPRDTSAIMSYLGINSDFVARSYVEGIRNYSAMKTIQIIEKFREIDCKSKGLDSNGIPAEELAQELVFFILH